MSRFFQKVVGGKEPLFSTELRSFESRTGKRGLDVAYQADVLARAHETMRQLGLDVRDTTKLELYRALIANVGFKQLFKNTADVCLVLGEDIISFNHNDIEANATLPFDMRQYYHGAHALLHELMSTYERAGVPAKDTQALTVHTRAYECRDGSCDIASAKKRADSQKAPSVLCIGDIFTDAFIKLDESYAFVEKDDKGNKWLKLPFGSKPPYERVDIVRSVGPSPNAAVSCARLGLSASLMSWIGADEPGKQSLSHLHSENVDTAPMITEKDKASSYWYVLRHGADRTMLVKSEKYRYEWKSPKQTPDWIYLAYIGEDSWLLHQRLVDYLEANPSVNFAFQPGTFHFEWGPEKLKKIYARATIIIMNREEAVDVTGESYDSVKDLCESLHNKGAKYVVITDGPNGSYASHNGKLYRMPNYPDPAPPLDRTGAGDAFASTIVASLANGTDFETALTWAPINSMNVIQELGAQSGLLSTKEIKKYLKKAPSSYKLEEMK